MCTTPNSTFFRFHVELRAQEYRNDVCIINVKKTWEKLLQAARHALRVIANIVNPAEVVSSHRETTDMVCNLYFWRLHISSLEDIQVIIVGSQSMFNNIWLTIHYLPQETCEVRSQRSTKSARIVYCRYTILAEKAEFRAELKQKAANHHLSATQNLFTEALSTYPPEINVELPRVPHENCPKITSR